MSRRIPLLFSVLIMLLATLLGAVAAQDDVPGPGEGGIIVWGNQRGSGNIDPITPLRCSGVDCADMYALIYPAFVGLDPATLSLQPNVPGAVVTGWDVSDDNLEYTFYLRDDMTWSDGTPITAYDVYFGWAAIVNMDLAELSASLGPARQSVVDAEVVDDYTIILRFDTPNCQAINNAALVSPIPAHIYGYEFGADFDWNTISGHEMDYAPAVSGGPFQLTRIEPGTAIYLEPNHTFADPHFGYIVPSGLVYLDVPDYNIMAERLIAGQPGDINYIHEPDALVVPTLEQGGAQVFAAPGTLWHYVSLNVADPSNPQSGVDADGNPIDQGAHPILGDKRTRQALQHAINIEEITEGPLNGLATPMVAGTIPTAYTLHPSLMRRPFDLDEARRLLEEAGWAALGDPLVPGGDGLRIATEANLYAAPGTEFVIDMMNVGDVRNDVSVLLQAQFAVIGVRVDIRVLDFNTMYDNYMGVQIYDTAVAGWRGGIPFNPDQRSFFGAFTDVPSDSSPGFNFGSWYNAEFEELSALIANNPGCDEDVIKEAAWRVQEIMWDEQPYLWLYAFDSVYAAGPDVANFDPYPAQGNWNIDAWFVRQ